MWAKNETGQVIQTVPIHPATCEVNRTMFIIWDGSWFMVRSAYSRVGNRGYY